MQARILAASLRVLRDQGALAFTTTRVADEAGISVGSLYQYFPNKHALVAALHDEDIRDGVAVVSAILDRPTGTHRQKLHELVLWFFTSEAEEAATLGAATDDIRVFLRRGVADTAHDHLVGDAVRRFAVFIASGSTVTRTAAERQRAVQLAMTTIEAVGKALASRSPSKRTLRAWADDTATMLADHLGFA